MELYILTKIKLLRQLGIVLNKEQKEHIKSLKTEHDVDRYARDLIIGND